MIKSIRVLRATVGTGILEPVQCSPNLQIAVNNSDHITILEPKLPLLHQCVSSKSSKGQPLNTIDANALYDVRTILHVDNLESLGLQIFSRILIQDGESLFNFGRIAEPMIVGHKWSPMVDNTKDSYLGVLLNTGDVLVLARDTLDTSKYSVKFRSFTCLLDQMKIAQECLTPDGDIVISNLQYLQLKVNSFEFGKLSDGRIFITLSHESKELSLHELSDGLPFLENFDCGGICTKQFWSSSSLQLFLLLNDNSVYACQVNEKGKLENPPKEIKAASRFLVSQIKFLDLLDKLIIIDTKAAYLADQEGVTLSVDLPFRSVISSLPIIEEPNATSVYVVYETGKICVIEIAHSDNIMSIKPAPKAWKSFLSNTLYKYQLKAAKEQNKAPSKVFQPYWTENLEANFYNFGTQLLASSGVLVTVYSLAPKNIIHHEIKSKMDFVVSFLRVKDFSPSWSNPNLNCTSLSFLHSLFMQDMSDIPLITQAVIDGVDNAENETVVSIKKWKLKHLEDPKTVSLDIYHQALLPDSLIVNFRNNPNIKILQRVYSLNLSLIKTLSSIHQKRNSKLLSEEIATLAEEQDLISHKIRQHVAEIVTNFANDPKYQTSDMDQFIFSTFSIILGRPTALQKMEVTITSELCSGSFEIDTAEAIPDDFLKFAKSTTGHKWPRCDLTFVPLLSLLNKSDELELLNYSFYTDADSILLQELYLNLAYCIYTGNRTFATKVGV